MSSLPLRACAVGTGLGVMAFSSNQFVSSAFADAPAKSAHGGMDKDKFVNLKLNEVFPYNHNTKIYRFALDSPDAQLNMPIMSYVVTKARIGEEDIVRPYTPIAGDQPGALTLLVKAYPQGKMSKHFDELKVGETLAIKGPLLKYKYEPNKFKQIGMIAGGTGITPCLQLIEHILANKDDKTLISLVYANIAAEDILLKEKLDSLAQNHKNFFVHYVLEKPSPAVANASIGYVSSALVNAFMPSPTSTDPHIVMVCGPPPMMKAVSGTKGKHAHIYAYTHTRMFTWT
jgi:cytochrome-b5 reductase